MDRNQVWDRLKRKNIPILEEGGRVTVLVVPQLPAYIGRAVDSLGFGLAATNTTFDTHHSLRPGPDIVLKTGTRYFQTTVYLYFSATGRGDHTRNSSDGILLARRPNRPDSAIHPLRSPVASPPKRSPTSPARPFPQCLPSNTCLAWLYLWGCMCWAKHPQFHDSILCHGTCPLGTVELPVSFQTPCLPRPRHR